MLRLNGGCSLSPPAQGWEVSRIFLREAVENPGAPVLGFSALAVLPFHQGVLATMVLSRTCR